jgi:hypothetical protein
MAELSMKPFVPNAKVTDIVLKPITLMYAIRMNLPAPIPVERFYAKPISH